jgi:hypothetical protein
MNSLLVLYGSSDERPLCAFCCCCCCCCCFFAFESHCQAIGHVAVGAARRCISLRCIGTLSCIATTINCNNNDNNNTNTIIIIISFSFSFLVSSLTHRRSRKRSETFAQFGSHSRRLGTPLSKRSKTPLSVARPALSAIWRFASLTSRPSCRRSLSNALPGCKINVALQSRHRHRCHLQQQQHQQRHQLQHLLLLLALSRPFVLSISLLPPLLFLPLSTFVVLFCLRPLVSPTISHRCPRSAARKSAPLNVLIVTFELAGGPKPAGGIGTAYQQLALALAGAGHRVVVLLSSAFPHRRARVDAVGATTRCQRHRARDCAVSRAAAHQHRLRLVVYQVLLHIRVAQASVARRVRRHSLSREPGSGLLSAARQAPGFGARQQRVRRSACTARTSGSARRTRSGWTRSSTLRSSTKSARRPSGPTGSSVRARFSSTGCSARSTGNCRRQQSHAGASKHHHRHAEHGAADDDESAAAASTARCRRPPTTSASWCSSAASRRARASC